MKLTKMLRDFHTLRTDIRGELARLQLESPEQIAALCTEAFEEGFTVGIKRGDQAPAEAPPKPRKKRRKSRAKRKAQARPDPKKAALRIHRKVRDTIVETLGVKSLTRGQIAEKSGLDPELVSQCIHREKGTLFVGTPGHRWKVDPKAQKSALDKRRQQGRKAVATGERPTFRDAIAKVMGRKVMRPQQVMELLVAADTMPESKNPMHYVNYTLCHYKDTFQRVSRGKYRVHG